MAEGTVNRHWRARFRLAFSDDPRYGSPTSTTSYTGGAWIGAGSEEEARALLEARIVGIENLVAWDLDEMVEATNGEPEIIALWDGEGAP